MKLTVGMIRFLDERKEEDLIALAIELRSAYALTSKQAFEIINQWINIPII